MKHYIYYLLVFIFTFNSCSISKPVNYSFEDSKNSLHPQFLVYHQTNSKSKLYFQLDTEDLLYSRKNLTEPFSAKIYLEYIVYQKNRKEIIDSGSYTITNQYIENKKTKIDSNFNFRFPYNQLGFIEVKITDVNRSKNYFGTIEIDKFKQSNRQFFLLSDTANNIIFDNYFRSGQSIIIKSNFNYTTLFASNNNTVFPLSSPPFSKSYQPIYPKKTASSSKLNFSKKTTSCQLPENGFVFFQLDTNINSGFTLFNFHSSYPNLNRPELLIPPLRYLTTKDEYNMLIAHSNPKVAVDQYWLSKGASKERARSLIRTYYSRVEFANKLFTCHLEGWKTDRGLISIIFGPPNYISNNKNMEVWNYGDENNLNSLKFIFEKKMNPFSSNDFALKRNYSYRNPWYRAVESWRNGKVYLVQ
jgi:GWxTD domain-containing protein